MSVKFLALNFIIIVLVCNFYCSKGVTNVTFRTNQSHPNESGFYSLEFKNIAANIPVGSFMSIIFPGLFLINNSSTSCYLNNNNTINNFSLACSGCNLTTTQCNCNFTLPAKITNGTFAFLQTVTNPPFVISSGDISSISIIVYGSDGQAQTNLSTSALSTIFITTKISGNMTLSSSKVLDSANYTVTIYPYTNIPPNGWITYTFPSDASIENAVVYQNNLAVSSSLFTWTNTYLTLILPSGFTATSGATAFTITIGPFSNPIAVGNYSFGSIITYYNNSHSIDEVITGTVVFSIDTPNTLQPEIDSSSLVVSQLTNITFTVDNDIFVDSGYLLVTFPTEFDLSSVSCALPTCNSSGQTLQFSTSGASGVNSFSTTVLGVKNPISTQPTSNFNFSLISSSDTRKVMGTNTTINYTAVPGVLTVVSVTRAIRNLATNTSININFTASSAIPTNGVLEIYFPLDQLILADSSADPTSVACVWTSNSTALSCSRSPTNSSVLIVSNLCSGACASGQTFNFNVTQGATNPSAINDASTSSLTFYTKTASGGYIIDAATTGIVIEESLKPYEISINVKKTGTVVGENVSLTYNFTPNSNTSAGKATLSFPDETFYPPTTGTCSLCTLNGTDPLSYIKSINVTLPTCTLPAGCSFSTTITVRNKINTAPILLTDAFTLETRNSDGNRVDYSDSPTDWTVDPTNWTATQGNFSNVNGVSDSTSLLVGSVIPNFTLSFTPSTEVPSSDAYNSRIVVTLPSEIVMSSQTGNSCTSTLMTSPSADLTCSYNSTANNSIVNITHNLADPTKTRSNIISVSFINLLQLPPSTKPSSNFTVTSISTINGTDYTIDQTSNSNVAATTPASIVSYKATRTNSAALKKLVTFTFTPINIIPPNGIVELKLPTDQLVFDGSNSANVKINYNSTDYSFIGSSTTSSSYNFTLQCISNCSAGVPIVFTVTNTSDAENSSTASTSLNITTFTADGYLIDTIPNTTTIFNVTVINTSIVPIDNTTNTTPSTWIADNSSAEKENIINFPTPVIITLLVLSAIALILFIVSLALMPKPYRNSQSFIILLTPIEWLSMVFLIPNVFVNPNKIPFLCLIVGIFSGRILLGTIFNHLYLGVMEDTLNIVKRHKKENPKTYGFGWVLSFIFGLNMAKIHSSGIFGTDRATFAELSYYRSIFYRYAIMGIIANVIQICTDIWGLSGGVKHGADAYNLFILNFIFNSLLTAAILLDLWCNKPKVQKVKRYNKVEEPRVLEPLNQPPSGNDISQLDVSRDNLIKSSSLKDSQKGARQNESRDQSHIDIEMHNIDDRRLSQISLSKQEGSSQSKLKSSESEVKEVPSLNKKED